MDPRRNPRKGSGGCAKWPVDLNQLELAPEATSRQLQSGLDVRFLTSGGRIMDYQHLERGLSHVAAAFARLLVGAHSGSDQVPLSPGSRCRQPRS